MPSSLTMSLSSASVCSTRPPVSVCGTGGTGLGLRRFSRRHGYLRCWLARGLAILSGLGSGGGLACPRRRLPPFNGLFRQPAGVSLPRLSVASRPGDGMLTVPSIGCPSRVRLRARLTLIRIALIRKPWPCGGGVSRPPCRYLYLHLPFRRLQRASRRAFGAAGMLPYRPPAQQGRRPHVFGTGLMPDYYPRADARPVSCYALFE